MMKYLVSIVIPTKNRQEYCIQAVLQILSMGYENLQVCIQDNSDDDRLKDELQRLNSSNVVYNYHAGVLSFVDNFSEAISLATGDYICMIGDDDGVLPNILSVAGYCVKNNVDAIIPSLDSVYFWPSEKPIHKGGENGYLTVTQRRTAVVSVDSSKALICLLKNGLLKYTDFDLPRVYHGLVKREMFEKIIQHTGKLFDGLTPDIYMAGALSLVCEKVARMNSPITVSGICPTSGSADSATGRHTGELKDAPHFRGHASYSWEKNIPYIYTVETIWAETLFKVLHNFKKDELSKYFNLKRLTLECYEKYPQFSERLIEFSKEYNFTISKANFFEIYFRKTSHILKKIKRRILFGKPTTTTFRDVTDIKKAVELSVSELTLNIENK